MFIFLCMFLIKVVSSWKTQSHYSLYQVIAFNYHERNALYEIHVNNDKVLFLNGVTNNAALPMDVVVHQCCTEEFEMDLQDKFIEYISIDSDKLQEEFNIVYIHNKSKESKSVPKASENFFDWDTFIKWVDSKCKRYPTLQKIIMGNTHERREMLLLKLSTGGKKPAAFIMAGEQGRDWISTTILLNFINYLLETPQDMLLKEFDFYFLPIFNPDGYEYSMKHDRFWIKNRKTFFPPKRCSKNHIAVGVSIDRNWFLAKATTLPNSECNSVFLGSKYLTEEETKALSSYLNSIATNLLAFINLRGFGHIVTVPFAESEEYANNLAVLMEILLSACEKVKQVFNVTYRFSNTASCLFNFSGNCADWVKMKLNVPIVYTIYMHEETFVLPNIDHVIPLTKQFTLMVREMLVLGSSIYGPLFSKQSPMYSNTAFIVFSVLYSII